jgi:SWI/SNF-related matrix-associated actin-dependent regulator of chromatin subfamily A3
VNNLGHDDIVLTTYEIVARQLKKFHSNSGSSEITLFSYHWHRVVLDEAHRIQNRKAYTTKAVCALQADRRWAMSGTPVLNKLTDLASIIEFLRVYPFSDPDVFNDEITRPWQEGDRQGVLRLKKLVNAITLCRSKDSIDLPRRTNIIHDLEFSSAERKVYNEAKDRTATLLDNAMSAEYAQRGVYLNALQWLNTLRLICSHGIIDSKETGSGLGINDNDCLTIWDQSTAQKALNNMICAGAALCVACGSELSEINIDEVSADIAELDRLEDTRESYRARLSQCLFLLCGSCVSKSESSEHSACSHNPKCPTFEVSLESSSVLKPALETQISEPIDDNTPTKLKALVKDLQKFENTKSVVFSFWTFTLDLIGRLLEGASIKYTRIDGKLSADKRSEAIAKFQTDASIQVILVSITCGGTGLNLTAASRAYLLEPQRNPMLEEQAFSRIDRMGQKKEVTTIRYRMVNSFEQKVVLIQDRKKNLANLTFSNARLSEADIGTGRLQYLRAALS